jgi:hypothetical protein
VQIQEHLSTVLVDPSSVVKRAVLHGIAPLCVFLGRGATNDVLLSHMITYLNDRDPLLRTAFFESIVDVAACAGGRSLDEYILPLMIQALSGILDDALQDEAKSANRKLSNRCGRNGCRKGLGRAYQPLRTGSIPEDAYMGTYGCDTWLFVSP